MRTLFDGIGFELQPGQALRISGANGSGKTSLLRILALLSRPEQGNLWWNDTPLPESSPSFLASLAYLGHKNALKADLTPIQNLRWQSQLGAREVDQTALDPRIHAALGNLDVDAIRNRPVKQLSAGQRQRVGLARVWLSDAPLWILDEPATALDPEGVDGLQRVIEQHLSRKGLLVYTSHQEIVVDAQRLTVLQLGK